MSDEEKQNIPIEQTPETPDDTLDTGSEEA